MRASIATRRRAAPAWVYSHPPGGRAGAAAMMRAMPAADPPAEDPSADPPGWAALWPDLLALQAGQALPAHDGPARPRPVHRGAAGWTLAPSAGPVEAWFELYKPLLDARHAQRTGGAGPWVVAQLGQSLDGCIATAGGDSAFVTGPPSLTHLHRLRALCDAVLVGAGTVAADDPRLTTRRVAGPQPVRVVIDPTARLDGRARLFRDGAAPTLWLCDAAHAAQAQARLAAATTTALAAAAEVLAVPGLLDAAAPARRWRPAAVVDALAARGLRLLFVEGGGVTVSAFLAAGALDRLHLVVAPVLIGDGRRGLQGPARAAMADCLRPPARVLALGEDRLWDLDLRARRDSSPARP